VRDIGRGANVAHSSYLFFAGKLSDLCFGGLG